jgi:transposase InsO family protein
LASLAFERETAEAAQLAVRVALKEAKRVGLLTDGVEVKSDHGSPFIVHSFRGMLEAYRCTQALSAVRCPTGMGRVERVNRMVKAPSLGHEVTEGEDKDEIQIVRRFCDIHRYKGST